MAFRKPTLKHYLKFFGLTEEKEHQEIITIEATIKRQYVRNDEMKIQSMW